MIEIEILTGLVSGLLIGASGMGTGSIITPVLILLGHPPATAIGTGLGALFCSKSAGAVLHRQLGHWPGRLGWFLIAGGVQGVLLSWLAQVSLTRGWLGLNSQLFGLNLKRGFGLALLLALLVLLLSSKAGSRMSRTENRPAVLFLAGTGIAVMVAFTSVGSGSLLLPLLAFTTAWNTPQMAATSNFFGWVVGALSVALLVSAGWFDAGLFLRVGIGLAPGVVAGVLLSRYIARRWFVRAAYVLGALLGLALLWD